MSERVRALRALQHRLRTCLKLAGEACLPGRADEVDGHLAAAIGRAPEELHSAVGGAAVVSCARVLVGALQEEAARQESAMGGSGYAPISFIAGDIPHPWAVSSTLPEAREHARDICEKHKDEVLIYRHSEEHGPIGKPLFGWVWDKKLRAPRAKAPEELV